MFKVRLILALHRQCLRSRTPGSTDDLSVVFSALQGCYGVWVNTDSFTLGEDKETWQGIRIFELAKQAKTLKHYIYSHLDYAFKETDYNPKYSCDHYNGELNKDDQ